MATANYPEVGGKANARLASGSRYEARWDGLRWWLKVNGDRSEVPVERGYVVAWEVLAKRKAKGWVDRVLSALRIR